MQIAKGLVGLHAREVVHGKLQPEHIMQFSLDQTWKIINFDAASFMKKPSKLRLNGRYSSPEQYIARHNGRNEIFSDPSSDVWSFGVLVYEALTGRRVFFLCFANLALKGNRIMTRKIWMPS